MKRERPINADLPDPEAPEEERTAEQQLPERPAEPKVPAAPKPRRQPKPLTPKLLAALVLIAIAFIVAAVLGGTGGADNGSEEAAPAPTASAGSGDSDSEAADSLGFPAFATNNTTRIGGSDPATIAAAAALAVYPSTTPAQQPQAVTLVPEEDWAAGIAASVLMAEPVRAPVLVEGAEVTAEALEALDPKQTRTVGGGGSAAKQAARVAELRDRLFGSAPDAVLVVPSAEPEIAMPAAAWAARSGDPVLFAGVDDLPAATATALRRHTKVPVYVLGPSSAISSKVLRGIGEIAKQVKRVSGEDPVANAIAFARYSDGRFGWNVNDPGHGFVLARDGEPLDAAAAAALSGSGTWGPLLLTDSASKLPAELRSYFLDVKPGYTDNPTRAFYNRVWVIGDEERIDLNQQAEVNELAELTKIGGEG